MLIRELHLLSDDLEGTEKFYHQTLGLSLLHKTDDLLTFSAGQTTLSFHRSHDEKPQYHFAFNIPCNQIYEGLKWMQGKASLLEITPNEPIADFKNWHAKAFYFLDNNENILEFIARDDLHNEREEAFGPNAVLSVSEIGIVGDDAEEQSKYLIDRYGLDYFSKQPPLPRFAALGDDEGLFIVVPYGREWYPTDILSSKHWVAVHLNIDNKEEVFEMHTSPSITKSA